MGYGIIYLQNNASDAVIIEADSPVLLALPKPGMLAASISGIAHHHYYHMFN